MATTNGKAAGGKTRPASRRARGRAERARDLVGRMTPAERRALLADVPDDTAPSMAAAGSDLLRVVMAAAAEFAARYYPDARNVGLTIFGPNRPQGGSGYHVHIPCPAPAKG